MLWKLYEKKNEELNDEIENFRKNYEKNFKIHEKFDIEIFGLYIFCFINRNCLYEYAEEKKDNKI